MIDSDHIWTLVAFASWYCFGILTGFIAGITYITYTREEDEGEQEDGNEE